MGVLGGQTFGVPFGTPEKAADIRARVRRPGAAAVRVRPATGYGGQWWGIYVAARRRAVVWAAESGEARAAVALSPGGARQAVVVLPHGQARDTDHYRAARELETADRVTLSWTWPVEVIGAFDAGAQVEELSSWSLDGLDWTHLAPQSQSETRGTLTVDVSVAGGTATVTVSGASGAICSGSGSAGGAVTLDEANGSGVSGSVSVDSGCPDIADATLRCRVPARMRILRGTTDPPTALQDTVSFRRTPGETWTEPDGLAAGTYVYALRPVSDTGQAGTAGASASTTISSPPDAPTDLAYDSGDAAATTLSFTASATDGATYRAYLQGIGAEHYDLESPAATAAAGETTVTLPAITGYPGTARVVVRAVASGVEEQNAASVALEYDASGAYVAPRPNVPTLVDVAVSSGTSLSVEVAYDPHDEAASPATVELYARDPDGTYTYASPAGSASLSAADGAATRTASVDATLSAGWHYLTARALTSAGLDSGADAPERLVYISSAAVEGPDVTLVQSGG